MSKFFNLTDQTKSNTQEAENILKYSWSIWYHSRAKKDIVLLKQKIEETSVTTKEGSTEPLKPQDLDQYLLTTKQILFPKFNDSKKTTHDLGTLEQLWTSVLNLKSSNNLPIGAEYLVFKSGIKPIWEDPINSKGGRWVFRFSRRFTSQPINNPAAVILQKKRVALIWERLLLRTCGGSLFPEDNLFSDLLSEDISGLVLSVRKDDIIISVWNTNLCFEKYRRQEKEKSEQEKTQRGELSEEEEEDEQEEEDVSEDSKKGEKKNFKLTPFSGRSAIRGAILRIIRECDAVLSGSDIALTIDASSHERVNGVTFDYRLHNENLGPSSANSHNSGSQYHNSHHSYQPHHNNRPYNRRYNNNNNGHRHRDNKDESASNVTEGNNNEGVRNGQNKSIFANLGRRRRGIENSVEGGEPSGLLFGARRKLMQQQALQQQDEIVS